MIKFLKQIFNRTTDKFEVVEDSALTELYREPADEPVKLTREDVEFLHELQKRIKLVPID